MIESKSIYVYHNIAPFRSLDFTNQIPRGANPEVFRASQRELGEAVKLYGVETVKHYLTTCHQLLPQRNRSPQLPTETHADAAFNRLLYAIPFSSSPLNDYLYFRYINSTHLLRLLRDDTSSSETKIHYISERQAQWLHRVSVRAKAKEVIEKILLTQPQIKTVPVFMSYIQSDNTPLSMFLPLSLSLRMYRDPTWQSRSKALERMLASNFNPLFTGNQQAIEHAINELAAVHADVAKWETHSKSHIPLDPLEEEINLQIRESPTNEQTALLIVEKLEQRITGMCINLLSKTTVNKEQVITLSDMQQEAHELLITILAQKPELANPYRYISPFAYLLSAMKKRLINLVKEKPTIRLHDERVLSEPAPSSPATSDTILDDRMKKAFAALSEKQRKLLTMKEIEGVSTKNIAATLGISVGAVRDRLFRARYRLKALLQETKTRRSKYASLVTALRMSSKEKQEQILGVLPILTRKIFLMHEAHGMTMKHIAEKLRVPLQEINKHLIRARASLRFQLSGTYTNLVTLSDQPDRLIDRIDIPVTAQDLHTLVIQNPDDLDIKIAGLVLVNRMTYKEIATLLAHDENDIFLRYQEGKRKIKALLEKK